MSNCPTRTSCTYRWLLNGAGVYWVRDQLVSVAGKNVDTGQSNGTSDMLQGVVLPDGTAWTFTYDGANPMTVLTPDFLAYKHRATVYVKNFSGDKAGMWGA